MNQNKFGRDNMDHIKSGFLTKMRSDEEYQPVTPRMRVIRKSSLVAIAAVAVVLSTTLGAFAAGFDPVAAWQNLFEKEDSIQIGQQVSSAGISMDVEGLYTDGEHAILKMTLRDLEGDRLSDDIKIPAIDQSKYKAYVLESSYDTQSGALTCVVNLNLQGDLAVGDTVTFAINSIIVNLDLTDEYHPFDYDLYEAAANSALRPDISNDDWAALAEGNPVPAIHDPFRTYPRGGVDFNTERNDFVSSEWMPLDTAAEGEALADWLSLLGVGYEDGILHVQLRYNGLFGCQYQYPYMPPVLIDREGTILAPFRGENGMGSVELAHCGYQEVRFDVGDMENLKDLKLAWTGEFAERVIDGDWSVDISVDTISDSISGATELPDHPHFTGVSYTLSPMYLETEINFADYSLDANITNYDEDGIESTILAFDNDKIKEQVLDQELAIVLNDGTRIELPCDRLNLLRCRNGSTGKTWIVSRHQLNGSFDIQDVTEVIIFGVSFPAK